MLVFVVVDQRFRLGQPFSGRVNRWYRLCNRRAGTFTLDAFPHGEALMLVAKVLVERRVLFKRRNLPQRLEDLFQTLCPRARDERVKVLSRQFCSFVKFQQSFRYRHTVLCRKFADQRAELRVISSGLTAHSHKVGGHAAVVL